MPTAPACLLQQAFCLDNDFEILTMFGHDICLLFHNLDVCSLEMTLVVILGNTKEN